MPGIRLHHPTLRAAEGTTLTYVVELPQLFASSAKPGARDRSAEPCPTCGKPHARKSLHLKLNADGDVIVAPDVYLSLKAIPTMAGLELVNEVKEPPPLFLGAVHQDKSRIVEVPLDGQSIAPKIVPERTKYEGRDRLHRPFEGVILEALERDDRKQTKKRREKRRLFVSTITKG